MLVKEYRILLPLTVDEYRIAQLYMIQKKSSVESTGTDSGVEILVNEPYTDGPGGSGQYTYKVYHVGSHLPSWFRSILPKSALRVEEEAWNAYPYTKTRYTCPFVERFLLEVETVYYNDAGDQSNVFGLKDVELKDRIVDVIDIVNDQLPDHDYLPEEDPTLYHSMKTGRGPLTTDWVEECKKSKEKAIMCAYKVCRVEFRYWGMQSKIEKFIHDIGLTRSIDKRPEVYCIKLFELPQNKNGWKMEFNDAVLGRLVPVKYLAFCNKTLNVRSLRKTMLRAHRQAWAWQDEWFGLTIDDIRVLEKKAQELLSKKMGRIDNDDSDKENAQNDNNLPTINQIHSVEERNEDSINNSLVRMSSSQRSIKTLTNSVDFSKPIDHLSAIRSDSLSDDEFFDAPEILDKESAQESETNLTRCSSMDLVNYEEKDSDQEPYSPSMMTNESPPSTPCETKISILFFVFHGGPLLDSSNKDDFDWSNADQYKNLDFTNFKNIFESVVKRHYPGLSGRIAFRLISCPPVTSEATKTLARLCLQKDKFDEDTTVCCQQMPLPLIPILAYHSSHYKQLLSQVNGKVNQIYKDFLSCEEGYKFNGEVCFIGDCTGGMFAYDCLTSRKHYAVSRNISTASNRSDITNISMTIKENEVFDFNVVGQPPSMCDMSETTTDTLVNSPTSFTTVTASSPTQIPSSHVASLTLKDLSPQKESSLSPTNTFNSSSRSIRNRPGIERDGILPFYVSQLFLLGTPIGTILTYRKLVEHFSIDLLKPNCGQIFNLFYRLDPCSSRMEPLLHSNFSETPPIDVPRYQQFPLGDGKRTSIDDWLKNFRTMLSARELTPDTVNLESDSTSSSDTLEIMKKDWWGDKRLDYALHCPEGLGSFPVVALPGIIHSSFWESHDLVAFLIRQSAYYSSDFAGGDSSQNFDYSKRKLILFTPSKPTEKWIKRTTSFKIRNSTANHRGNDVIVLEGLPQVLHARFVYGMLDVASLSGEKISVYIMENSENGEWIYYGESLSDSNGRVRYEIEDSKRLPLGVYPIKMVVGGDHTFLDMIMAVIPKYTECVVFSIDGSFTASVSVSGRDPRVRPGAIDIVRHWQDLGYMIIYVTARPCMQQQRVVGWLAQHNFPRGMLFFTDGVLLTTDPLRQKTLYLKRLVNDCCIKIHAAYGSTKDVHMYKEIGVDSSRIFVVGRASKKWQQQACILSDGYTAHLMDLTSSSTDENDNDLRRPANGKGRSILTKSHFFANLPHYHGKKWTSNGVRQPKTKLVTSEVSNSDDLSKFDINLKVSSPGVQRTRSFTPRRAAEKRNVAVLATGDAGKRSSLCESVTVKPDDQDRRTSSRHLSPFKFWSQSSSKHK